MDNTAVQNMLNESNTISFAVYNSVMIVMLCDGEKMLRNVEKMSPFETQRCFSACRHSANGVQHYYVSCCDITQSDLNWFITMQV